MLPHNLPSLSVSVSTKIQKMQKTKTQHHSIIMSFPKTLSTLTLLLLLIIPTIANSPSNNIQYDIYPFIRVYTNGTVQRFFGQGYVPPSTDPTTGVHSRDVKISQPLNISARIFLPGKPDPVKRHPVLVYFHGGGFFSESAFSPSYHRHLNSVVAKGNVIAVSVNYRLAPEHHLPVAYQDSWVALEWVFEHFFRGRGSEVWLKRYADFGRVYLGGDSAGANIVHNMAIRVGSIKLDPGIRIQGMFLNCPYFLGKSPVGQEATYPYLATLGKVWLYAYPKTSGLDDPLVNPAMDPSLRKLGVERVLVYVAGLDVLRFRGWYYASSLKKSGWNGAVNVVEAKGENHVYVLINPTSPNSVALIDKLAFFLNH